MPVRIFQSVDLRYHLLYNHLTHKVQYGIAFFGGLLLSNDIPVEKPGSVLMR